MSALMVSEEEPRCEQTRDISVRRTRPSNTREPLLVQDMVLPLLQLDR